MPSSQNTPQSSVINDQNVPPAMIHLESERAAFRVIEDIRKSGQTSNFVHSSESRGFVWIAGSPVEDETKAAITNGQVARKRAQLDSDPNETILGHKIDIFPTESVVDELQATPKPQELSLQGLRDEVRMMVAEGKPHNGIPAYKGRKIDGDPVKFLQEKYAQYLPAAGQHTLFLHDLRKIDSALAEGINNAAKITKNLPIGTVSNLIDALEQGYFYEGSKEISARRVRAARRRNKT